MNESAFVYEKSSLLLQAAVCHAHSALLYEMVWLHQASIPVQQRIISSVIASTT